MPTLLSPDEVAPILKISTSQVNRLCRDKKLPAVKVGRCWVTTQEAVDWYLENRVDGRGNPDFGVKWKGRGRYYEEGDSAENS